MLEFFRRYQKYIFLVVTIVVIISFSFFGTFSTLDSNPNVWREQVAFTAVNGDEVTRLEVEDMALFIATDNSDKLFFGGRWGPNFLNDGVIQKDFIETGLITELAMNYRDELKEEYEKRLAKEKKYQLYSHPEAKFLNIENIWSYFSPKMTENFHALRSAQDALDENAFDSRVHLFLEQKKIPASNLRQMLRYQEKQYSWLQPDPKLDQTDLSLYGYYTFEDWFSPQMTRLISEFIINAAIIAEQQGYEVSRAETLADLARQTQLSYQQNSQNPNIGVASPEQYFNEQLRRLQMDKARAIKIWRQVLLFRRYFQDAGSTALIDTMAQQKMNHFGYENVSIDLYQMPPELQFSKYEDLQDFQIYLNAVAKNFKEDSLELPTEYLSVTEVEKKAPALVQKKYVLDVSEINPNQLQARVGLRQLWKWETDAQNWKKLIEQFPELAMQPHETIEERFEALDQLDLTTRNKVDSYAKEQIIDENQNWSQDALDQSPSKEIKLGLSREGGKTHFQGLDSKEKREEFFKLLDVAPLNEKPVQDSPLFKYSADGKKFYRITVISREAEPKILTFEEAKKEGIIKDLRTHILEEYYLKMRDKNPDLYSTNQGEWQPYEAVKELVANQYFEPILGALQPIQKKLHSASDLKETWSRDEAAAVRFYSQVEKAREEIQKDSAKESQWIDKDDSMQTLANQWKLRKTSPIINRQNQTSGVILNDAMQIPLNEWSDVKTTPNGIVAFYKVNQVGVNDQEIEKTASSIRQLQQLLGNEAQKHLMLQVLEELKVKNALSLAYLKTPSDGEDKLPNPDAVYDTMEEAK